MTFTSIFYYLLVATAPIKSDSIVAYFNKLASVPQEKIYLQTDKSYYGAGENIWFKAYLTNAINHREDQAWSNYVFVDLLNRADSLVMSKKVKRIDGIFCGNLKINPALPPGDYYIHAYTGWMLNEEQNFHFFKKLQINNLITNSINAQANYSSNDSTTTNTIITFKNNNNIPDHCINVHFCYYDGKKLVLKGSKKTQIDGTLQLSLPTIKNPRINITFNDPAFNYNNDFYPTIHRSDYQVTFFPEGGDLIPGSMQKVAFKAQAENGYAIPVNGVVKDSKGDVVADIHTDYDGMGMFFLSPKNEDVFHAEVVSSEGVKKNFLLPDIHLSGFALKTSFANKYIYCQVERTTDLNKNDTLFLAAHQRGSIKLLKIIDQNHCAYKIPETLFNNGIVHFLLIDKDGKARSERLFFVFNKELLTQTSANTDKQHYDKRDKVNVNIQLNDANNNPLQADLSACITDDGIVKQDSLQGNIITNLLLTSDLKGYIEHPAHYFDDNNTASKAQLDLLMMTNGWRRFKVNDLSQKPDLSFKYFIEKGESFGGSVFNIFGKLKNAQVTAFAPKKAILNYTTTDDNGHFVFQGQEYPDSTMFIVSARTRKGGKRATLVMDKEIMPPTISNIIYSDSAHKDTNLDKEYIENAREEYYKKGGMKVINLKEVVVKAKKRPKPGDPNYSFYYSSDRSVSGDILKKCNNMTAYDVVLRLPGVMPYGVDAFKFMKRELPALLIINDVVFDDESDYSILRTIDAKEVERVDGIIDSQSIMVLSGLGKNSINGGIVVTLKSKDALFNKPDFNIAKIIPRGYNESVEFYSPVYDTPDAKTNKEPDLRSTIYWAPKLKTDVSGKTSFSFYTNDRNTPATMIIEGISKDGCPIYLKKKIKTTQETGN